MADKQISELTENSSPVSTDLMVCQQSTTAKKITLTTLRNWALKVAGLTTSVSSDLTGSEYLLVDQNSTAKKISVDDFMKTRLQTNSTVYDADYFMVHSGNYPRKVAASTLKSYCGSGGGGSGALYADYGSTTFSAILSAVNSNKAVWCVDDMSYAPLVEINTLMPGDEYISFLDIVNSKYLIVNTNNVWSRVAM